MNFAGKQRYLWEKFCEYMDARTPGNLPTLQSFKQFAGVHDLQAYNRCRYSVVRCIVDIINTYRLERKIVEK